MGGGGEDGHVGADLGDDVLGADRPDAVDGVELGDLVQPGLGQRLDPGGERLDLGGVVVDGGEHHRQHGGVFSGEEAGAAGGRGGRRDGRNQETGLWPSPGSA